MDRVRKRNMPLPDWQRSWTTVVLSWVNSFQEDCNRFSRLYPLSNAGFIKNVIEKILTSEKKDSIAHKNVEESADWFLKEYFPNVFNSIEFNPKSEEDILILVTLTMLASCLKVQVKEITYLSEKNIDPSNQEIIVKFFQSLINVKEKEITRSALISAVQHSLGSSNFLSRASFSPGSPGNNLLQDFFDSPALQDRKDKDRMLITLKAHLDDEQNEKAEVLEENENLKEQLKRLQTILIDKDKENNFLKETLNNSLALPNIHIEQTNKEKSLMLEIEELNNEIRDFKQEQISSLEKHKKDTNQINSLQKTIECVETELDKCLKLFKDDHSKLIQVEKENEYLRTQMKELQQTVEQLDEKNTVNDVQNLSAMEPEAASAIIDLQLIEKQEEIYKLNKKLYLMEEEHAKSSKEKINRIEELETMSIELEESNKSSNVEMGKLNNIYLHLQEQFTNLNHDLQLSTDEKNVLSQRNIKLETDVNHLKNQLAESTNKIELCTAAISEKEQECAELLNKIKNLESEKSIFQDSIDSQINRIEELETMSIELEESKKSSNVEMGKLNNIYLHLQEQFTNLSHDLQLSTDEKNVLSQRNIKLETDVNHLKNQLAESTNKIELCTAAISEKEQECAELLNKIKNLESEKSILQDSVDSQINRIEELETMSIELEESKKSSNVEMGKLNNIYLHLQEQFTNLNHDLQLSTDEKNVLSQRNIKLETDVNHLKNQLAESTNKIELCTAAISEKEQECAELLNKIKNLESEKSILQDSIDSQINRIEELETMSIELEESKKSSNVEMGKLNNIYLHLQEQFTNLSHDLQLSTDEKNVLSQRNIKLETDVNHLKNQLAESTNKIELCTAAISEKEQACAELLNKIKNLESEKSILQDSVDSQINRIEELETMSIELEESKKSSNVEMGKLNNIYLHLQEQFTNLSHDLQLSTDEKNVLSQRNIKLETDVNHLKNQLAESTNKIELCTAAISEKEQECAELLNKIKNLESEKSILQDSVDSQINRIEELETMSIELEESKKSSNVEMGKLNNIYLHLQEQFTNLSHDLQLSTDEKNVLSQRNIKLETDVNHLKNQLAESTNKIELCTAAISEKEQACAELLNKIKNLESEKSILQDSVDSQINRIEELETMSIELEESKKSSNVEMGKLNNIYLHLQEQFTNLSHDLQLSTDEKNVLSQRNIKLETDVNHLKNQLAESTNKIELCTAAISEKEQACAELLNKIKNLESEKSILQDSVDSQINRIEELETMSIELEESKKSSNVEMGKLNNIYLHLQEQFTNLSHDLQLSTDEKNVLSQRNIKLETDVNHLKNQLAESTNKIELCTAAISEKEQECAELLNKIKNLESEKSILQDSVDSQINRIEELETMSIELEESKKSSNVEMGKLNNIYLHLQEQFTNLSHDLQLSTDEKNVLSQRKIKLETDVNHLKNQLAESTNKIELCTAAISEKEQECAELLNKIKNLESEKSILQDSVDSQINRIEELETMSIELEESKKSSNVEMGKLNNIYLHLQEQFTNLNHDLQLSTDEKNVLSQRNIKLETDVNHLKNQLAESTNKIELCTAAISEKEQECAELLNKIKNLESEKSILQDSVDSQIMGFKSKITELSEEIDTKNLSMQNSIVEVELKVISLESVIKDYILVKKELNQIIEELNKKLYASDLKIQNMTLSNDKNIKTIEDLRQQLDAKVNELDHMLSETESFHVENKDLNDKCKEISSESQQKLDQIVSLEYDVNEKKLELETLQNQVWSFNQLLQIEEGKVLQLNSCKEEMLDKISVLENKCSDLEKLNKESESKVSLLNGEIDLLKDQLVSKNGPLNEAHDELFNDYHKLSYEYDALVVKYNTLKITNSNTRAEYDEKLKKLKDQMKETCTRAMKQTEENCEMKIKHYKESILSTEDQIRQLSSQLWDTSDKLVVTKKDNEELKSTVSQLQRILMNQNATLVKRRTRSHENLSFLTPEKQLDVDESVAHTRRRNVRAVPSGLGKVFPSEDEAEEMFSNECLADLKAGHCRVSTDPNRVSTLMYRNSLCPPHLKSSYPAETQFLPVGSVQEDEIKGREGEVDCKSLFSEKRRKERSQTSYKRPGPPTPSKNGGRASLQNQPSDLKQTPRNALKELNDEQKKISTPGRLFSNMFSSRHKDENTPTTTNQKKLSFFKSFGKRE